MSAPASTAKLRVLIVHNRYLQAGGEDTVVETEKKILESRGHAVGLYETANLDLAQAGWGAKLRGAANAVYARAEREPLRAALRAFRPDVAHVHNFFNRLSPAIYDVFREAGTPVTQTLHNFRLLCLNAFFYRDGRPCEDCLGKPVPWPGVWHACYRGSRAASATVAAMLTAHRLRGTWQRGIHRYIALTEFARGKFIEGGLPAERIVVKPNLVYPAPTPGAGDGGFAVFVGRLSEEKGIRTMLEAWKRIGTRLPLKIVGDGPLLAEARRASALFPGVECLGRRPRQEAVELMKQARLMVFPSVWYEMFSMTVIEALSVGLPVIASDLGSMPELIQNQRNGLRFRPGDAGDLAAQVEWTLAHEAEWSQMRRRAREDFQENYTAARNYELLVDIYQQAISEARGAA